MTQRKQALVVDDDPEIQRLIRTYLPDYFTVHTAYAGEEGVKLYNTLMEQGWRPDVVVMDLNLSGTKSEAAMIRQMEGDEMDGVQTAEKILQLDPDANIVGFTAFADLEWGDRLKETGAVQVFSRNIGFDTFSKKIQQIVA
ncbi:MAG: response regulator [Thermoplasmatota archaeon]